MRLPVFVAAAVGAASLSFGSISSAQTCNDALTTTNAYTVGSQACLSKLTQDGRTVDDIFRTSDGKTGADLINLAHPPDGGAPSITFGKLVTAYPGCDAISQSCNGYNDPNNRTCAGGYVCGYMPTPAPPGAPGSIEYSGYFVNDLDWLWGQEPRLKPWSDPTIGADGGTVDAGGVCPPYGNWVGDGDTTGYNPWEGYVFNLGGPSNKVVLFPINDHGPQPCESIEYTVYLTNNPYSREKVDDPTTNGADPNKWNRAKLVKLFLHGWTDSRDVLTDYRPYPGGCGDIKTVGADGGVTSPTYAVEADSFTSVWSLPCGIAFKYAGVISGNDGKDFAECHFDSADDEIDAVIGLSEEGNAVCPDKDGDGFVDCACPTHPPVCDCDDGDPNTHPNAPEPCDATKDYNCNGHHPEACPSNLYCNAGICVPQCPNELQCAPGSTCESTDGGRLCVPNDCTVGGCPPGSTCDAKTKKCVPACNSNVVCPPGEACVGGECVDPCKNVSCASGWYCNAGTCEPPCSCFSGDVGCTSGTKCDRANDAGQGTNQCLPPDCVGVTCPAGQICETGKGCVAYCNGVVCPGSEVCVPKLADGGAYGCVDLCQGVTCPAGSTCDPSNGQCKASGKDGGLAFNDSGAPPGDASFGDAAGTDDGRGNGEQPSGDSGGCSCNVVGGGGDWPTALGALAAIGAAAIAFASRRKR